jgi:hypothetical protein
MKSHRQNSVAREKKQSSAMHEPPCNLRLPYVDRLLVRSPENAGYIGS